MARCYECNSILTKKDLECFVCGEPVPGAKKRSWRRKKESKPAAPVTPVSNLLFVASLVLMLVSFLSGQKIPVAVTSTLSGILFIARIVSDRIAVKQHMVLRQQ